MRSFNLEIRASTERITATWGDCRGCPDWQLGGAGDCPGESNLYKQPGNAALGEPYSHDEPPRASTNKWSLGQCEPWVTADAAVTISWNTTGRTPGWEPRPFQLKLPVLLWSFKAKLPLQENPIPSAPVVRQLTGVRATGIAAARSVARCNEQEADGMVCFYLCHHGAFTCSHVPSCSNTHSDTLMHILPEVNYEYMRNWY